MEPTRPPATALSLQTRPVADGCPRCGQALGLLPAVAASLLDGVPVRRCEHCGTRATIEPEQRLVFTCEACGLPFLVHDLLPRGRHRCERCATAADPVELPDAAMAAAAGEEVRVALAEAWGFVGSPVLGSYLERIARQTARRIEGTSGVARVAVFEDRALRTLALPPATVLISTGTLASCADEAELSFVLGHELAHAAGEDAAIRLARLGLRAVAHMPAALHEAWARAGEDLVRLGYGRRRERDADARALEATIAAGYDPESVRRYLGRLHGRIEVGDPCVCDLALAHPPASDRLRRVDRALYGRLGGPPGRTNREPFRRVASERALAALVPVDPFGAGRHAPGAASLRPRLLVAAGALLAAAALTALIFVLL